MTAPDLLVDGRTLDDRHPGVKRYWVPILRAWAEQGGDGRIGHRAGLVPEPALVRAGFEPIELPGSPRHPLALVTGRAVVRASGAKVSLSPLYLTLDGAPRNLATVYDTVGRTHASGVLARWLWEAAVSRTRRRASRVIVPSRSARAELAAWIPALEERLAVVSPVAPPPPDGLRSAHDGIEPPFALVVASHRPHKRLAELATLWRSRATSLPLVIAGAGTRGLDAPPSVRGLGFVSDAELEALLRQASCLVSASQAEGFGLPLLAALAAGVPIVATRLAAHEELVGAAGILVEPDALEDLVDRAVTLAADSEHAARCAASGRRLAAIFTPERAASELERALRE